MPKTPLTHHLVALWFADIAGYSDRAAEDERSALHLIEILQSLSRDTVRRYEGRVVKFMGDAVLAEFPSTELAVRAATALSEQYAKESAGTGSAHNLRVGVHVADVAVGSDGDLYGDGVNAAARVQEAAEPGQVLLSEDVWRQLRGRTKFQFESLGDRLLKGVGSIGLYAVTLKESATRLHPARAGTETAEPQERKAAIRSIAVLPFADLSAQHDQEYFSDGVAEEILNALTKVAGLRVPARTSCFAFRGTSVDAREIGKRLGVETLLEGGIRKAGNRLRISVQLIDARNGYQLWSKRFDREIEDIFAIQDEIARRVLDALGLSLTEREQRRFLKPSTRKLKHTNFICADVSCFTVGLVKTWNSRGRCSRERLRSIQFCFGLGGTGQHLRRSLSMGSQFARFEKGAAHKRSRVEARSESGRSTCCHRPGTRHPATVQRCRRRI
jgi:adenylate cyclase